MLRSLGATRQASINLICSYFTSFEIRSTKDLDANFEEIVKQINLDPNIFKPTDTLLHRTEIFAAAVAAYAHVTEYNIHVPSTVDLNLFAIQEVNAIAERPTEDLSKVTQSYDELAQSLRLNKATSNAITRVLKSKEYSVCDSIILGAGDTGISLWLDKYKAQHGATHKSLAQKKLPDVLMISDEFGSWRSDYTLAQTQSSLERSNADKNPSDFMSTEFYQKNPQANARHVFQANQICLGATQAPVVKTNVLKIEKKENHSDWQSDGHPYRLIVQFPQGETKAIYTNNIEVCTGLGAANTAFEEKVMQAAEVKKLYQVDSRLGFSPVVDGNQFVLDGSETEQQGRSIVIYGGGGTASACYRKCFFGTDVRTYDLSYTTDQQKNEVTWVYKDFIGTGKMAENALRAAENRNAVFQAELVKVTQRDDGKLSLEFKRNSNTSSPTTQEVVCDRLVYSIGQNDIRARQVCSEVSSGVQVRSDKSGMLLYVSTPDDKIRYFGAAAVAVAKSEFLAQTGEWLTKQNIGGDVGAGSMPPTRAQIKQHLAAHKNVKPENINANMDNSVLIKDFLVDAGIKALDADNFIQDLIVARKHDTSGCTREMLAAMMSKHKLDAVLEIYGHSHLVLKGHNNQARSSTRPILTVLDSSAKNKQTRAVDDMLLGVKLGYKFSKPLIVASNVSDVVSTSSTVALDKSGQKHDILPTSSPALVSQTSKDGLFGITRRKEETDSFAFISTAANTDTSEDEESVKDKVTTTPSIKVNGS